MADYDNNMRGVLFRNDRQENEKQPGYTGKIEIDGVEYRLSAFSVDERGEERQVFRSCCAAG